MNWDDEAAHRLLGRCREAMAPPARLLVVESLMPDRGDPRRRAVAGHDLNLLLLWGGRHRTGDEMVRLLERSGLEASGVVDDPGLGWQIVEARRLGSGGPSSR